MYRSYNQTQKIIFRVARLNRVSTARGEVASISMNLLIARISRSRISRTRSVKTTQR
jgi:hypothetical protein